MKRDLYKGWTLPAADIDGMPPRIYGDAESAREWLARLNLPDAARMSDGVRVTPERWEEHRAALLDTVRAHGYGYSPAPAPVTGKVVHSSADALYAGVVKTYAGKAISERIHLTLETPRGPFTFPLQLVYPIYLKRPPVLLHIAFRPSLRTLPDDETEIETCYAPIEEIIDHGFAYAQFCYNDVAGDLPRGEGAFLGNGLAGMYHDSDMREPDAWGKIGIWAYAASRVLDYLRTRKELDGECVSVAGHSRLGKTALWCAAQDERFFCACVNGSGWGGAGLMRMNERRIDALIENGSIDWWSERFRDYAGHITDTPFDGHTMLACVAPRYVSLADADGDFPLYQVGDYLSATAAGAVCEALGLSGFIAPDMLPHPYAVYPEGHIGYALRPGSHFFSRWDWNAHMAFIKQAYLRS